MSKTLKLQTLTSDYPGSIDQPLTDKQRAFVDAFVTEGKDQTSAAQAAGYTDPRVNGWRLLQIPHVVAAIRAKHAAIFQAEGVSRAWRTLKSVMDDETCPTSSRVQAAKITLDVAGYLGKNKDNQGDSNRKSLSDMSIAELEAFIGGGMERLRQHQEGQVQTIEAITTGPDQGQDGDD